MNLLLKEITDEIAKLVPSKPCFNVALGWSKDGLLASKAAKAYLIREDVVSRFINNSYYVREVLINDTYGFRYKIVADIPQIISQFRYEIIRQINSTMLFASSEKNVKQSALYKWLLSVSIQALANHSDLETDLWNLYKWTTSLSYSDFKKSSEEAKAFIFLLEKIKFKYTTV